jgi:putative transposase
MTPSVSTLLKGDGNAVIESRRLEVPNRYRHLALLEVRFAAWDLAQVHLVDPHTGTVPCRLFPQDKGRQCHHGRRATSGPLAARMIDRQAAIGLLPATCLSPRAHELKRLLGGRRSG